MIHMTECWIPLQDSPATGKNRGNNYKIFLLMISLEQLELKWNNVSWLNSSKIFKLALKTGMMWHLQDKEFAEWMILNQGRTSRQGEQEGHWWIERDLRRKKYERRVSIVLLQCTRCTEAFWDRWIGCRVGHNFSVAPYSPNVLQGQHPQQLEM